MHKFPANITVTITLVKIMNSPITIKVMDGNGREQFQGLSYITLPTVTLTYPDTFYDILLL